MSAVAQQTMEIGKGERLLVLAPHPDDETLSSAGLIQQVLQQGGSVRSTVVTSGDAYVGAVMQDSGRLSGLWRKTSGRIAARRRGFRQGLCASGFTGVLGRQHLFSIGVALAA
ncbi:PIG-L family deacetylase [Methylomonas sp. MO1]|uniref:PIG-L family deacetylase n=1 Tax=Methylomonas sp. MO1 TaxID=3073619 RepID=UPI0028A40FB6|nr:PIG-L family deacetylase [Methylomonas sp. MO1]MDT4288484.1 PIG-L family deacetylase [Methylomonas sp. MO1]